MKLGVLTAIALSFAAIVCGAAPAHADDSPPSDKSETYCRLRVHGGVLARYVVLGSTKGRMGCPVGIERVAIGGGRMQEFDGGSIYWSPATDAHAVTGRILDLWKDNRGEAGCIGYPIDEEADTPDGRGRYQHFQHGTIWHWNDGKVSAVC
jgi:uncharacterized protein with LGFP repeats